MLSPVPSLYALATWALQPFVRRKLARRATSEPLYGEYMEERFGSYLPFKQDVSRPLIWIHAVSLGETRAAAILLRELRKAIPHMRLLLSSGTATGRSEGEKLLQEGDIQVWQPWDTRAATRAFFEHFKPTLGVLMETEIWPHLIASARAAHVPTALVNARMSDKSFQQSKRWYAALLAQQAYRSLAAVYAQTQGDAARLTALGAKVTGVLGNLKFDITPTPEQVAMGTAFRLSQPRPIILLASSREGEEALLLTALQALPSEERQAAQWLIVPRHPQRFDEVAGFIEAAGFGVIRRSQNAGFSSHTPSGLGTIWLGDSLGEMAFYYSLATSALLGGSFARLGGQNLIEALACGCPIVMGPHMFNFEEAASLAAASNVAFKADNLVSGIHMALALGSFDRDTAVQFVAAHQGAAAKLAAQLAARIVP